jgi:hypothetical protein
LTIDANLQTHVRSVAYLNCRHLLLWLLEKQSRAAQGSAPA